MAIPVFYPSKLVPMPKCVCCGAPADYVSQIMPMVSEKICCWCAVRINPSIVMLALGYGCGGAVSINGQCYDLNNWNTFPDLVKRIDSLKNQQVELKIDQNKFPHKCPSCGSPAYIGLLLVECSNDSCH